MSTVAVIVLDAEERWLVVGVALLVIGTAAAVVVLSARLGVVAAEAARVRAERDEARERARAEAVRLVPGCVLAGQAARCVRPGSAACCPVGDAGPRAAAEGQMAGSAR